MNGSGDRVRSMKKPVHKRKLNGFGCRKPGSYVKLDYGLLNTEASAARRGWEQFGNDPAQPTPCEERLREDRAATWDSVIRDIAISDLEDGADA